jgi:hypothetical protein
MNSMTLIWPLKSVEMRKLVGERGQQRLICLTSWDDFKSDKGIWVSDDEVLTFDQFFQDEPGSSRVIT